MQEIEGNRGAVAALLCVLLALVVQATPVHAGAKTPDFIARGEVRYEDKAWSYDGWTGARPTLPVRRADVFIVDATTGKVVGRGATALDGSFEVPCRSKKTRNLVARIDAATKNHTKIISPYPRIRVTTPNGTQWSAYTSTLFDHAPDADADFPPVVVDAISVLGDEGNPFNVFDMSVAAFDLALAEPRSASPRRSVQVVWPNALGSFALNRRAWIATDDGFDDAVILHELGHLVHNVYSDSDNPGGPHVFGHSDQDPRLSFGEGYATFYAGAVLNSLGREAMYLDCDGAALTGGVQLRLRLENAAPYTFTAMGACDEVAVACVLHDLIDDENTPDLTPGVDDDALDASVLIGSDGISATEAWWRVFTGPVRRAKQVTMNHAWDGWLKTHAAAPRADALQDVFGLSSLVFWDDAAESPFTTGVTVLPAPTSSAEWSGVRTLYQSKGEAPEVGGVGLGAGTGDRDEWVVWLEQGQRVTIETRYPDGLWDAGTQVDPFLAFARPNGKTLLTDDNSGTGRNAAIKGVTIDTTGLWRITVSSKNKIHRYGRYELRIRLDN